MLPPTGSFGGRINDSIASAMHSSPSASNIAGVST